MIVVRRIGAFALQLVLVLDELVQVFIRGPIYLLTGHNLPSAHETISAWIGVSAALGKPWAVEAARLIDSIFGPGHCARAAVYEASIASAAD